MSVKVHRNPVYISPISRASCHIELLRIHDNEEIGRSSATGFLWQESGLHFLVSNWHVFSGFNPETGLSIGSFIPNAIRLTHYTEWYSEGQDGFPEGWIAASSCSHFYSESDSIIDDCAVHPSGREVDIAAFPFRWEIEGPAKPVCANLLDIDFEEQYFAGDDAFVVGFPEGFETARSLPLWKRGTIATDPDLQQRDRTEFYLDINGFKGMSGSPVYSKTYQTVGRQRHSFIGIYAGRLSDKGQGGQIGRVISRQAIFHTIENYLERQ